MFECYDRVLNGRRFRTKQQYFSIIGKNTSPTMKGAKMKKSSAPPPPQTKVTTPLSQSLDSFHSGSSSGPPPPLSSCDSSGPLTMGPQQHVSDDCAINELLEGRMDLEVFLPDGRQVRMNVERRTPMMDLLVQVTTANKISPGGHVIHILTDRGKDFLHYKPSTPIGSLDTNCVYIVPKSSIVDPPIKKMPKVANKPFEQTFRLQVNLPRGQLMVHRVSPRTTLSEIKLLTCREKNLEGSRYQMVHPQFPNQILDLNSTLSHYGYNEISLMSTANINANIRNSTSDLIAYATREEDKKKRGGILGIFTRKKSKGSVVDSSSDSMDSRGVSPTRSDSSGNQRSKTTVKKRPAPPPPPLQKIETGSRGDSKSRGEDPNLEAAEAGSTVSHSRHSSDSSGYHEASLLSESPDIAAQDICGGSGSSGLSADSAITTRTVTPVKSARKSSNPVKPTQTKPKLSAAVSDSSLQLIGVSKKRRAPPPPPSPSKSEAGFQKTPLTPTSSNEMAIPEEKTVEILPEPTKPSPQKRGSPTLDIAVSAAMKAEIVEVEEVPSQSKPVETSNVPDSNEPESKRSASVELHHHPKPSSTESSTPSSPVMDSGIGLGDSDDHLEEDRADDLDEDKEALFLLSKGGLDNSENLDDNWFAVSDSPVEIRDAVNSSLTSLSSSEPPLPSHDPHADEETDAFVDNLPFSPPVRPSRLLRSLPSGKTVLLENNARPETFVRQPSLTSLRTIDDVQNSFDLTIAEAEKVLEEEEHERRQSHKELREEPAASSPKKRSLAVSQQQILSHIEAAFNAVEEQANEDLPASREVQADDDLGWEYTIPEPPPAFRNDEPDAVRSRSQSPSIDLPASVGPSLVEPRSSVSSVSSEGPPPPLPSLPPPERTKDTYPALEDTISAEETREYASLESHFAAPKLRRPPLLNFTIGSYKKSEEDIFGDAVVASGCGLQSVPESSELKSMPEYRTPSKDKLEVKNLYVLEGSVRGVRGQVKQRCAEMADTGSSPALIGRSASMLSLAPTRKTTTNNVPVVTKPKTVQRANSNAESMRKAQSVQNLNGSDDEDLSTLDLEQEQARLQEEYTKLHQQFVIWNQQLRDNQHVLERQKIVPSGALPPVNGTSVISDKTNGIDIPAATRDEDAKSQTLPRQRPKFSVSVEEKRTSTLERPQRPKSQVLANVTIGSWQQRKVFENGTSKAPFQSVENINRVGQDANGFAAEEKQNGYRQSQSKPRPVSVHLGGWTKNGPASSASARDEIDVSVRSKPKIDIQISNFNVKLQQQQQQPVSLRSSSTKTNFKPPEVKQTSASRQRLPPEARTEETTVNGIDGSRINGGGEEPKPVSGSRVTRTSSSSAFEKFVFGANQESRNDSDTSGGKTVTYLNGLKEPVNGETKTIQVNGKAPVVTNGFRPSFAVKTAPKVVGFKTAAVEAVSSTTTNATSNSNGVSINVTSTTSDPPPPPPQPQVPIQNQKPVGKTVVTSASQKGNPKKFSRPVVQLDPREELMLEIRNFGGRTSLRKVSVSQTNWQLKVHGASSTVTA